MISEKSITRCTFLHSACVAPKCQQGTKESCAAELLIPSALKLLACELMVFVDTSSYLLTESRNFKTFLNENYTMPWTGVSFIFTKKVLNMEIE